MSDVFTQTTMCKRNRCCPIISVVSFGTVCIGLLIEAREPVMDASQDCDFKLHNLIVTERNLFFARLSKPGSDELDKIYHYSVVTLVMDLSPPLHTNQVGDRYSLNILILDLRSRVRLSLEFLGLTSPISV